VDATRLPSVLRSTVGQKVRGISGLSVVALGRCIMKKHPCFRRSEAGMGAASAPLRCAGASLRYGGARE
jgi:hypothetical protein